MSTVKRIGPGSAFKVGLVLYGFLGLLIGGICALAILAGSSLGSEFHMPFGGAILGLVALIVCPILYGIIGGIVAVIAALLYNLAAGWVGGLELEIH